MSDDEYTVEDARNEQIAHLRTGVEMLGKDLMTEWRLRGVPIPADTKPTYQVLLEQDTMRDVAIDKMKEDPAQCNSVMDKHWLPYCPVHGYHPDEEEET